MMGSLDFLPTQATERGEAVPERPASFQVSLSDLEDVDSFFLDLGRASWRIPESSNDSSEDSTTGQIFWT